MTIAQLKDLISHMDDEATLQLEVRRITDDANRSVRNGRAKVYHAFETIDGDLTVEITVELK